MKEKKSCDNCKYINCFVDGHGIERRCCTNQSYLEAKANFKSTGRAHWYCTWYDQIK